jgi:hypothetical protein
VDVVATRPRARQIADERILVQKDLALTPRDARVKQRGSQHRRLARQATTVTRKLSEVDSLSHLPGCSGFRKSRQRISCRLGRIKFLFGPTDDTQDTRAAGKRACEPIRYTPASSAESQGGYAAGVQGSPYRAAGHLV